MALIKKPIVAQTHLLGHALNLLIQKNLIDLDKTEDESPNYLDCILIGKSTVINWEYIGYGEIRISVWWNFDKSKHPQHLDGGYKTKVLLDNLTPNERIKHYGKKTGIFSDSPYVEQYNTDAPLTKRHRYKDFVGVVCSTWVERKEGKYLQIDNGKGIFESYIRSADRQDLCTIPDCNPIGFRLSGRIHPL